MSPKTLIKQLVKKPSKLTMDNTEYTDIPEERQTWREMNETVGCVIFNAPLG